MLSLVARIRSAGMVLVWSLLGGMIVAAFFIAAFFGEFGPLQFGDPGMVILFVPLLTAFVLGLLLVDYELVVAVLASLVTTGFAIVLILLFMFAPLVLGVAVEGALFQQWVVQRAALSTVLLFPLILLGGVVGRAVGERILPPEDMRERRAELAAQTKAWHEELSRRSQKPPEGGVPPT